MPTSFSCIFRCRRSFENSEYPRPFEFSAYRTPSEDLPMFSNFLPRPYVTSAYRSPVYISTCCPYYDDVISIVFSYRHPSADSAYRSVLDFFAYRSPFEDLLPTSFQFDFCFLRTYEISSYRRPSDISAYLCPSQNFHTSF